jgi:hypothetical protein
MKYFLMLLMVFSGTALAGEAEMEKRILKLEKRVRQLEQKLGISYSGGLKVEDHGNKQIQPSQMRGVSGSGMSESDKKGILDQLKRIKEQRKEQQDLIDKIMNDENF